MAARQEEARLVHSKPFYNGSPTSHFKQKVFPRVSPQRHQPSNIVNSQNMNSNSANFRQFIVPQRPVTSKKNSDVTMRSVRKPDIPQYAAQTVFYTQGQPVLYSNECHSNYNQ
ncbi:unnamed protein product, partial [Leptidea sinapis]